MKSLADPRPTQPWAPPQVPPVGQQPRALDAVRAIEASRALEISRRIETTQQQEATVIGLVDRDRESAIRTLYTARHAEMVRFANFLVGDHSVAEDLTQDAFVRLYGSWSKIADTDKAVSYLRATIVNLSRDRFRRRSVIERSARLHVINGAAADDNSIGSTERSEVLAAVTALPTQQRACVVMRHWLRMTEGEIADTLDVSIGSVRTHIKRGVNNLQSRLGHLR